MMTEDRITTKVANIFNIRTYYFSYPFEDMINIYFMFHDLYFGRDYKLIIRTVLDIKNKNDYLGDYNKHVVGDIKDIMNNKLWDIIDDDRR